MIKVNRSVRIEWRNNPSSFELRNKDAFKTDFLRLGSAIRPVNELLSRSEEMRVLLPTVVGVSPIDSSWQERITTYLNDFLLEIPVHGLEFDTSYVLDLGNPALKSNIDELIGKLKKADKIKNETGSELEAIVLKRIKELDETELYKYVTFVNIPDYISWRYCLLSSKVANKVEDIKACEELMKGKMTGLEIVKALYKSGYEDAASTLMDMLKLRVSGDHLHTSAIVDNNFKVRSAVNDQNDYMGPGTGYKISEERWEEIKDIDNALSASDFE